MSISGNCRMCLVELKNSPKPIVSCAMNAKSCLANGDIYTNSPLVKKARENVLEFLLLNHPLDCPICDQGGECDLQDQSLFFGLTKKRFFNFKRIVLNKNIGPIVKTVMTRCIHCTRCVRFATEIAGIEDIGMFGRGLGSEIGTYVEKIFQSELSGNVIDLCPVGALTSKPYPFVHRSWELKSVASIDFSDGFGTPIQVFIKNNSIIRILPGYDKTSYSTNWISDKTRFSFDGMFSPDKTIHSFLEINKGQSFIDLSWKNLFKEFFYTLYFQNHLLKNYYRPHSIIMCIGENTSIEVLSLLHTLTKQYSFFKLRQPEQRLCNIDLEQNYLMESNFENKIQKSDTCLLVGINPRYEGFKLNLKLRSRSLKGNFKLIRIGSLTNLTFSDITITNSTKILKSLVEGNNLFCQEFINSYNPILVSNTEIFKRQDSTGFVNMLNFFTKYINLFSQSNQNSPFNILHPSLGSVGFSNFHNLKTIQNKDFKGANMIYFVNNSFSTSNIKKLLNLKLLNYFQGYNLESNLLITQSSHLDTKLIGKLKKGFFLNTHLHLPNAVFFETSGTYINTLGNMNKLNRIIKPLGQTKDNWQILRKIYSYSKKMLFITNFCKGSNVTFNSNNLCRFTNFIGFQHYAVSSLNNVAFSFLKTSAGHSVNTLKFKPKKKKLFDSQFRFWLNDFYIDDKNFNSNVSSTMIQCSKLSRLNSTNFKF